MLSNGMYDPSVTPQLVFPLGPARLAARLRTAGYNPYIFDSQAEGLFQVVCRIQSRRLGPHVGREPELKLHEKNGFSAVETGFSDQQMVERLQELKPDLILASLNFSAQAKTLIRQIKEVKKHMDVPLFIGGVTASMYPDILEDFSDLVLRGKFDDHIVKLVDQIRCGEDLSEFEQFKQSLATISHRNNIIDVDPMDPSLFPSFKLPAEYHEQAYELLKEQLTTKSLSSIQDKFPYIIEENEKLYFEAPIYAILSFHHHSRDIADGLLGHIMAREGCPFTCEVCHVGIESNMGYAPKIYPREPKKVIQEIQHLYKLGYRKIAFGDDQVMLPKNYLPKIALEVSELGMDFCMPNAVLAQAITHMDLDTLIGIIKSGFHTYAIATESASQKIVNQYWSGKVPKVRDTVTDACKKLSEASHITGIDVISDLYFVIGHAGCGERESIDEMYDSICFAKMLIDHGIANYSAFSLFIPAHGSTAFRNLSKENKIIDSDAMTFGVYSIKGEGLYSPASLQSLRLAGWKFANSADDTEKHASYNLDPNIDSNPYQHVDKYFVDHHLEALEGHYTKFLAQEEKRLFVESI